MPAQHIVDGVCLSTAVCVPPLLGWNDLTGNYVRDNATDVYRCILFQSQSYVLYSASGSFFVPFFLTVFLYVQIFIVLRKRMRKMRKATGGGQAGSQKARAATLTIQSTSRQNETSVLLPTAVDRADAGPMASIEMAQLSDGRLTEERTSLKTERGPDDIVREKVVQFTETAGVADAGATAELQRIADAATSTSTTASGAFNFRACFGRRPATDDNSDDGVVVSRRRGGDSRPDDGGVVVPLRSPPSSRLKSPLSSPRWRLQAGRRQHRRSRRHSLDVHHQRRDDVDSHGRLTDAAGGGGHRDGWTPRSTDGGRVRRADGEVDGRADVEVDGRRADGGRGRRTDGRTTRSTDGRTTRSTATRRPVRAHVEHAERRARRAGRQRGAPPRAARDPGDHPHGDPASAYAVLVVS